VSLAHVPAIGTDDLKVRVQSLEPSPAARKVGDAPGKLADGVVTMSLGLDPLGESHRSAPLRLT
jgi:hypothetical protein